MEIENHGNRVNRVPHEAKRSHEKQDHLNLEAIDAHEAIAHGVQSDRAPRTTMKTETPSPTNPAAFPMEFSERGEEWQIGMTLRYYFAAKAMQALVERDPCPGQWDNTAEVAYQIADEMLAEREKTHAAS
jgi:hypothetical protein